MKSLAAFIRDRKAQKKQDDLHAIKRVLHAVGSYRVEMVLKLLIIILTTLVGMIIPLIIRVALDDAILKNDKDTL